MLEPNRYSKLQLQYKLLERIRMAASAMRIRYPFTNRYGLVYGYKWGPAWDLCYPYTFRIHIRLESLSLVIFIPPFPRPPPRKVELWAILDFGSISTCSPPICIWGLGLCKWILNEIGPICIWEPAYRYIGK